MKHDLNDSNVSDKEDHIEENEEPTFVRSIFGTRQACFMRCLKCNDEVKSGMIEILFSTTTNNPIFYFAENKRQNSYGLYAEVSAFEQSYSY